MLTTRNRNPWKRTRAAAAAGCLAILLAACTPPGPKALLDGERLLQQGRAQEAVPRLRTAVELLPANAQAWNHLGLALHSTGQPGDAGEAYQQAIRLDRNLASAHYNLGCLWMEQGQPGKAVDALRTHVGLDPRSFDGWRKLGQAQLRLRQWEQAEDSFLYALRLSGRDAESLNGLGVSHQQRRRSREAWQCFTNAIGQNPAFAPAWLNLGVVAHQAGARAQAVQAYRQYARLRPDAAQAMGLGTVIQQLEATLPPTPPPSAPTNAAPAATSAAAGPQAQPQPTASPSPLPATRPPTNTAVAGPVQPRSPPAQPDPPPPPTPSTPAPVVTQQPPQEAESPSTRATVTALNPPAEPTRNPIASNAPATSPLLAQNRPSPSVQATNAPPVQPPTPSTEPPTPRPAAPTTPVVVVQLEPAGPVASTVIDEPWNGPLPGTNTPAALDLSESSAPPLIRPISARRGAPAAAEKRSFWDRANPTRWFATEPSAPDASDTATSPQPSEETEPRWRWANPRTWFRTETGREPETPPTTLLARGPDPASPSSSREDSTPPPRNPSPAVVPAPAPAPATGSAAPSGPIPRYTYTYPTATPAPGNTGAAAPVLAKAILEHQRGRLEQAIRLYEEVLRLDPSSFEARHHLASARLQEGDAARALPAAEAATSMRPTSAPARLNFALALDSAGYPLDAAAQANRILNSPPEQEGERPSRNDLVSAHLLLGNLYARKLDRPQSAREHYLQVLDLDPGHPQNVAIRRWLLDSR